MGSTSGRIARRLCALLAVSVGSVSAPALSADKEACVAAAEAAQRLHKQRRLLAAREQLLVCASPDCPRIVATDCTSWLGEVERKLASVIIRPRDGQGRPLLDVRVLVDGAVLASQAPSTPVDIDPGEHVFRCERAGSPAVDVRAALLEGERGHVVTCDLAVVASAPPAAPAPAATALAPTPAGLPPPAPAPIADQGGIPWPSWVLGGVAVAAAGTWAAFGVSELNQQKNDAAPGGCKPDCSPAEISSIQTKIDLAYASAAVAVLSLGAAVLIALWNPARRASPVARAFVVQPAQLSLQVLPPSFP